MEDDSMHLRSGASHLGNTKDREGLLDSLWVSECFQRAISNGLRGDL